MLIYKDFKIVDFIHLDLRTFCKYRISNFIFMVDLVTFQNYWFCSIEGRGKQNSHFSFAKSVIDSSIEV